MIVKYMKSNGLVTYKTQQFMKQIKHSYYRESLKLNLVQPKVNISG